jgi:hypothetical protein
MAQPGGGQAGEAKCCCGGFGVQDGLLSVGEAIP